MIPADQTELITAAVDGELSAQETRAFRRLLASSAEARVLFARLKADRDRLQAYPTVVPPPDLCHRVLARIASATPAPRATPKLPVPATQPGRTTQPELAPQPDSAAPSRVPGWVPVAMAASLLLGVMAGSFSYFSTQNSSGNSGTAKHPWSQALPVQPDAPNAVPSPTVLPPQDADRNGPNTPPHLNWVPVPHDQMPRVPPADDAAVAPVPHTKYDLIGSSIPPPQRPFEFMKARVPFLRSVAELEREDIRQELIDDLIEPAYRLDLFVRDTARGAEVFQNAAKAAGLTLFSDAATLDKLHKRQVAAVVIYTENLTPAELAALFAKLASEDAKFSPRVCDSLHAAPIVRPDEAELKQILGVDVGLFKRALGSNGVGGAGQGGQVAKSADTKPVSAGTLESVVQSVTSSGAKSGEHTAVLMTWQTAHPSIGRTVPASSAELKQFLAKRTDRKPKALPTIIVIRPVG
jgi:hypothetical protein